jgi:hypothetical protein
VSATSGEAIPQARPHGTTWRRDLRVVRVVRMAVGVTVAMAIAQAWAWPGSFVYVALSVAMLGAPAPAPLLRDTLQNAGYAVVVFSLIPLVVLFLLKFPIAFTVAYAAMIFFTVYSLHKGAPFLLILFTYLGLLLFPILASVHEVLPMVAAGSLMFSALLALLTAQLAHGLLPDPPPVERPSKPLYYPGYLPKAARAALTATIAVVPAMVFFLVFDLAAAAVVMAYIGFMSIGGSLAAGRHGARQNLIANTIGGLATLLFYVIMIAVPHLHFFIVLMLLTSLLFATRIFSGTPSAKYYGSAFTGLVILVSSSMEAGTDVDTNVIKRIIFITLAGFYVIMAMSTVERLLARRSRA